MKKSLVTGLITLGLAAMLTGCSSSNKTNVDTATEDVKSIEEDINELEVIPNSGKKAVDNEKESQLSNAEIGDEVSFGNYNGNKEWIILDKDDSKLLLVSKYAIDKKPLQSVELGEVDKWEDCELRGWLNSDYLNQAFDDAERELILTSKIGNPENEINEPEKDRDGDTFDRVFLLSKYEVEKYFRSNEERLVTLLDGTDVSWWTRSFSHNSMIRVPYSVSSGKLQDWGGGENFALGIRPAMWIDLSLDFNGVVSNVDEHATVESSLDEAETLTNDGYYSEETGDIGLVIADIEGVDKEVGAWLTEDTENEASISYVKLPTKEGILIYKTIFNAPVYEGYLIYYLNGKTSYIQVSWQSTQTCYVEQDEVFIGSESYTMDAYNTHEYGIVDGVIKEIRETDKSIESYNGTDLHSKWMYYDTLDEVIVR